MIEHRTSATAVRTTTPTFAEWLRPAVAIAAIGWGANQFAPLIVWYQQHGVSATATEIMFGLYALGLVPALLLGGRWSDRIGRRSIVLTAVAVSLLASTILIIGSAAPGLLFPGRFLAGISSGLAFGTGTAWIRELSASGSDHHAGARRATIAMTIGFGAGPLVAGLLAQWLPRSAVWAYVPHLVLCVTALFVVGAADRMAVTGRPTAAPTPAVNVRAATRRLVIVSAPFAPWVFVTASIALAYLPALVAGNAGSSRLAFAAVATAIPAFAGVAAQPLLRRWTVGRPSQLLAPAMVTAILGLVVAVWAAWMSTVGAVLVAATVLGAAYGITQFAGLADIQHVTHPSQLGSATSRYQALSYVGFGLPYLLTAAQYRLGWSPVAALLVVTSLAALAAVWIAIATKAASV